MKKIIVTIILLLTSLAFTTEGIAQKSGKPLKNRFGAFGGATYKFNVEQLAPSIKVYYEMALVPTVYYGLYGQFFLTGDFEYSIGIPVVWYPVKNLKLWGAPGVGFLTSVSYNSNVPPKYAKSQEESITGNFFISFGAGWNFDIKVKDPKILFTPVVQADFINVSDVYLSFGVNIDFEFMFN